MNQRLPRPSLLWSAVFLISGCGPQVGVESDGGTGTESTTEGSGSSSVGTTSVGTTSVGTTSTTATVTTGQTSEPATSSSETTAEDTIGHDFGSGTTGDVDDCGCPHPYVWVANAGEHTVSKINVETMEEEGRYLTREDGDGNPSRTSVNLAGDVVVANRFGGVTKFWADEADCEDRNRSGSIETSSGATDVLPWDQEECRAWSTSFQTTNQRPVAWTAGARPDSCDASTAKVWTVTSAEPGMSPGIGGEGGVVVYLLNGETGDIEETLPVPEFGGQQLGAYGGAVDSEGNFWFSQFDLSGGGQLARIDRNTLVPELFTTPAEVYAYGITVDHRDRPWVAGILGPGAARFDYATQTWTLAEGFTGGTGITEGPDGRTMYVARPSGVQALDVETLAIGPTWVNAQEVKGVGFDMNGFLWAIASYSEQAPAASAPAYKIDVETMTTVDSYDGLTEPYTYSDLTGSALRNFSCIDR